MTLLSGKAARRLRALAHGLDPVVAIGKEGLSEGVLSATERALGDHELVKVKLPDIERGERTALAERLALSTRAQLAGTLGRVAILYRRHPTRPKIGV